MALTRHKPYDLTTYDGLKVDWITKAALLKAEEKFGSGFNLTQGSYAPGYGPSAGTHDGGGVVDLVSEHPRRAVKALADVGFAAFLRPAGWDGGGGIEHVHAVLKGNNKAAPLARAQADHFDDHRNGLGSVPFGVNNGYVPDKPVEFTEEDFRNWQRERALTARLKALFRQREKTNKNIAEIRRELEKVRH